VTPPIVLLAARRRSRDGADRPARRPRRSLAVVLAALLAGCGASAEEPESGPEYDRWRDAVSGICREFRADVEEPDLDEDDGRSDAERARRLAQAVLQPTARLYEAAARETRAVALPPERTDDARNYVARFERRAENYATLSEAAARGDVRTVRRLNDEDGRLAGALANATQRAGVRC